MNIKCKNKSLFTWDDFLTGKIICHKCIAMGLLIALTVGLMLSKLTQGYENALPLHLIVWLTFITGFALYLMQANKNFKKENSFLKFSKEGVSVYSNGKRRYFESFENIKIDFASWANESNGLLPAFILKGQKIGKIRIGLDYEELEWVNVRTIFMDVHYTIDDHSTWKNFENIVRQYL